MGNGANQKVKMNNWYITELSTRHQHGTAPFPIITNDTENRFAFQLLASIHIWWIEIEKYAYTQYDECVFW